MFITNQINSIVNILIMPYFKMGILCEKDHQSDYANYIQ